jgi:hypothetical protein
MQQELMGQAASHKFTGDYGVDHLNGDLAGEGVLQGYGSV